MSTPKAAPATASAPAPSPERRAAPASAADHEAAWLNAMRVRVVAVRLTDGKGITGMLGAHDRGTIAVRVGDEKRARIIYKRAIAYVMEQ